MAAKRGDIAFGGDGRSTPDQGASIKCAMEFGGVVGVGGWHDSCCKRGWREEEVGTRVAV